LAAFMTLFSDLANLVVGQGEGAFIKRQSWNETVPHIHISPFIRLCQSVYTQMYVHTTYVRIYTACVQSSAVHVS
jgi:hypothetical protein